MSQTLRFEGKSLDEARKHIIHTTGRDIDELEVKRHGRELYGGLFGFFQKERYVIEVAPYVEKKSSTAGGSSLTAFTLKTRGDKQKERKVNATKPAGNLDSLAEGTEDWLDVNFDRELQLVLSNAGSLLGSNNSEQASVNTATRQFPNERYQSAFGGTDEYNTPATSEHGGQNIGIYEAPLRAETSKAPTKQETIKAIPGHLYDFIDIDRLNTAFSQDVLNLLDAVKAPADFPKKQSFLLGLIGDLELAVRAFTTIDEYYQGETDLIIMSDRVISRNTTTLKVKTPQELGEVIIEQRLAQKKTVVIFDQKSHLDNLQKSIMVAVPDALWAAVSADYDINQVNALDLCTNGIDALIIYGLASANNPLAFFGQRWPLAYVDGWRASKAAILAKLMETNNLS